jgi:hypothetical protein
VLNPRRPCAAIRQRLRPTTSLDGAAAFGAFWKVSMVVLIAGED